MSFFDVPFLCSLAELFLRPKVLLYSRAEFMTMCERARIVFLRIGYWEYCKSAQILR